VLLCGSLLICVAHRVSTNLVFLCCVSHILVHRGEMIRVLTKKF